MVDENKEKVVITPKEYTDNNEKIKDFIKGFFLTWLFVIIIWISIFPLTGGLGSFNYFQNVVFILVTLSIFGYFIFKIINYFKTKRYMAIGMLGSIVFLLLSFGACFVALSGI